jgi:hypothetical protein
MNFLIHHQPWEERMKTANEQGTLVLLQNLDPVYTSAEVEVLLILELWFFIGYIILFGIMMVVGTVINVGKRNIHLQCKSLSLQETFFFLGHIYLAK